MAGAVAEALIGVAVLGVFLAVWLRERRVRSESPSSERARLRDEDEFPP